MTWRFTKMHGLGNDFVVLDAVRQTIDLQPAQARWLADRHRGVGCDQILLVERARNPEADFRYRIFNADGGEVGQCGNGARCFARFVATEGLTDRREITVETAAGLLHLYLEGEDDVRVNMGVPHLEPDQIPLRAPARAERYRIGPGGRDGHAVCARCRSRPVGTAAPSGSPGTGGNRRGCRRSTLIGRGFHPASARTCEYSALGQCWP